MASPRSSDTFSITNVLQVALSILLGASLWPLLCQALGAFGEPGAIHDVAVTSSLIAGAIGGSIGCIVSWTFHAKANAAPALAPVKAAQEPIALMDSPSQG